MDYTVDDIGAHLNTRATWCGWHRNVSGLSRALESMGGLLTARPCMGIPYKYAVPREKRERSMQFAIDLPPLDRSVMRR